MLWDYVLPPELAAELFRALAYVPGITVRSDATDNAGRHGVAFLLLRTDHPGTSLQLMLNPSGYTLMAVAEKYVPPGGKITPMPKQPDSGTITWELMTQLAIIRQAYVSRPGALP